MSHPIRKQNRLRYFDYSTPAACFLTICTHEKRCTLSRILVGDGALVSPYKGNDPGLCVIIIDPGSPARRAKALAVVLL